MAENHYENQYENQYKVRGNIYHFDRHECLLSCNGNHAGTCSDTYFDTDKPASTNINREISTGNSIQVQSAIVLTQSKINIDILIRLKET